MPERVTYAVPVLDFPIPTVNHSPNFALIRSRVCVSPHGSQTMKGLNHAEDYYPRNRNRDPASGVNDGANRNGTKAANRQMYKLAITLRHGGGRCLFMVRSGHRTLASRGTSNVRIPRLHCARTATAQWANRTGTAMIELFTDAFAIGATFGHGWVSTLPHWGKALITTLCILAAYKYVAVRIRSRT